MTPTASAAAVLVLIGVVTSLPLQAAPATSEDIQGATQPMAGIGLPAPAAAVGPPQSRTVELLLQLQDQPTSLRESDGAKPGVGATRRAVAPAADRVADMAPSTPHPLLELKAGLLGPGSDTITAPGRRVADEERYAERTPSPVSNNPPMDRSGNSGAGLLAHPVIRFIRDNRALTITVSIGILAAVWLTANYRSRGHRR